MADAGPDVTIELGTAYTHDGSGTFDVVLTVTDTVGNGSADTMRVTVI